MPANSFQDAEEVPLPLRDDSTISRIDGSDEDVDHTLLNVQGRRHTDQWLTFHAAITPAQPQRDMP